MTPVEIYTAVLRIKAKLHVITEALDDHARRRRADGGANLTLKYNAIWHNGKNVMIAQPEMIPVQDGIHEDERDFEVVEAMEGDDKRAFRKWGAGSEPKLAELPAIPAELTYANRATWDMPGSHGDNTDAVPPARTSDEYARDVSLGINISPVFKPVFDAKNNNDLSSGVITPDARITTGGNVMTSLEQTEAESAAAAKNPDTRVELASMLNEVESLEYLTPPSIPHMTICVAVLRNGYAVIGHSAPADPANYDPELGQKFAKEDAIRKMWPLFGFLLRQQLHDAAQIPSRFD